MYPEGTVTKRPDHLPKEGKTGAVRLALATGVPIVPLASWGSQAVWQKSGRGSLKFGRPVWVKAGPPIDLGARAGDARRRRGRARDDRGPDGDADLHGGGSARPLPQAVGGRLTP